MPPQFLFDISKIDLTKVAFDQEAVRASNPQRGDMEMLDGLIWVDTENDLLLGFKDVRDDQFWVAGHIPGRPLFPGVLMIEAAAQLAAFYTGRFLGWKGFIGFGGVEKCRFRKEVVPPARLLLLGKKIWERHSRVCCDVQGVVDGTIVFEITIIGVQL